MKRFSLLLCVFLLVLWSFCIAEHATHNFEITPAALFDLGHWDGPAWNIEWTVPNIEIIADWDTQLYGLRAQILDSDLTYMSAQAVPFADSSPLLIFTFGLVLVWVSIFGEKLFKNKKKKR